MNYRYNDINHAEGTASMLAHHGLLSEGVPEDHGENVPLPTTSPPTANGAVSTNDDTAVDIATDCDPDDRDEILALALARGCGHAEAARLAGVNRRTVGRKLEKPEFRRRLSAIRAEQLQRGLGVLGDALADAAQTLRGLLTADSEMARLGAAKAVFELAVKLTETVELEARLTALEGATRDA